MVIELAQNWCAHLIVEIPAWGGVGLVEQTTGLPIGMRSIRCPYARAAGIAGMDDHRVALDFYDRNCVGCKDRRPVRLPNLLQLVENRDRELRDQEERGQLTALEKARRLQARANRRSSLSDLIEIEQVAELLLHTPLALPLFAEESHRQSSAYVERPPNERSEISVAFVSFILNDMPFGHPQTIEPGTLYDLTVEVRVSRWPDGAEELVLDVIAVEPPEVYQLPRFSFDRPDGLPPYLFSKTGRTLFRVPQALLSRPLEFAYRAWFRPEGCEARVIVEGQRHLRVQSFDPERNPQTGYREVDRRLLQIRTQVRAMPGVRDKELEDFLQILGTLGRIAGQAIQDKLFPGKWSERKFQDELKKLIRADPRIGSELEEHPKAAGGIADLSFRGIRIELKVESNHFMTIEDSRRFLGQTTQYVAGSDRRFGVLCMLDYSRKANAPGSVANDIVLQIIPPPDRSGKLEVVVGVVIIRGNLATPSSLSQRRKSQPD